MPGQLRRIQAASRYSRRSYLGFHAVFENQRYCYQQQEPSRKLPRTTDAPGQQQRWQQQQQLCVYLFLYVYLVVVLALVVVLVLVRLYLLVQVPVLAPVLVLVAVLVSVLVVLRTIFGVVLEVLMAVLESLLRAIMGHHGPCPPDNPARCSLHCMLQGLFASRKIIQQALDGQRACVRGFWCIVEANRRPNPNLGTGGQRACVRAFSVTRATAADKPTDAQRERVRAFLSNCVEDLHDEIVGRP